MNSNVQQAVNPDSICPFCKVKYGQHQNMAKLMCVQKDHYCCITCMNEILQNSNQNELKCRQCLANKALNFNFSYSILQNKISQNRYFRYNNEQKIFKLQAVLKDKQEQKIYDYAQKKQKQIAVNFLNSIYKSNQSADVLLSENCNQLQGKVHYKTIVGICYQLYRELKQIDQKLINIKQLSTSQKVQIHLDMMDKTRNYIVKLVDDKMENYQYANIEYVQNLDPDNQLWIQKQRPYLELGQNILKSKNNILKVNSSQNIIQKLKKINQGLLRQNEKQRYLNSKAQINQDNVKQLMVSLHTIKTKSQFQDKTKQFNRQSKYILRIANDHMQHITNLFNRCWPQVIYLLDKFKIVKQQKLQSYSIPLLQNHIQMFIKALVKLQHPFQQIWQVLKQHQDCPNRRLSFFNVLKVSSFLPDYSGQNYKKDKKKTVSSVIKSTSQKSSENRSSIITENSMIRPQLQQHLQQIQIDWKKTELTKYMYEEMKKLFQFDQEINHEKIDQFVSQLRKIRTFTNQVTVILLIQNQASNEAIINRIQQVVQNKQYFKNKFNEAFLELQNKQKLIQKLLDENEELKLSQQKMENLSSCMPVKIMQTDSQHQKDKLEIMKSIYKLEEQINEQKQLITKLKDRELAIQSELNSKSSSIQNLTRINEQLSFENYNLKEKQKQDIRYIQDLQNNISKVQQQLKCKNKIIFSSEQWEYKQEGQKAGIIDQKGKLINLFNQEQCQHIHNNQQQQHEINQQKQHDLSQSQSFFDCEFGNQYSRYSTQSQISIFNNDH